MFKPIPEFPHYEINEQGQVRHVRLKRIRKWTTSGGNPYFKVSIYHKGKTFFRHIHHLVMSAFVGPRPEGMVVRHIDGDLSNNSLDNLAYGTHKENTHDALHHGTMGKLTPRHIRVIRGLKRCGFGTKRLSEIFGVCKSNIRFINAGATWTDV